MQKIGAIADLTHYDPKVACLIHFEGSPKTKRVIGGLIVPRPEAVGAHRKKVAAGGRRSIHPGGPAAAALRQ